MKHKMLVLTFSMLIMLLASGCGRNNVNTNNDVMPTGNIGFSVGDTAPDFSIIDVDGKTFTLSEAKGRNIVISFFATWCTPCQIEANNIKKVDNELGGSAFEALQIDVDQRESETDLKQFKDSFANNDWIVGFGFDVAEQYGVRSLDTTLIINREGIIVYRDNGIPASVDVLRKWLA